MPNSWPAIAQVFWRSSVRLVLYVATLIVGFGALALWTPVGSFYETSQFRSSRWNVEVIGGMRPEDVAALAGLSRHDSLVTYLPLSNVAIKAGDRVVPGSDLLLTRQWDLVSESYFAPDLTLRSGPASSSASRLVVSAALAKKLSAKPGALMKVSVNQKGYDVVLTRVAAIASPTNSLFGALEARGPLTDVLGSLTSQSGYVATLATMNTSQTTAQLRQKFSHTGLRFRSQRTASHVAHEQSFTTKRLGFAFSIASAAVLVLLCTRDAVSMAKARSDRAKLVMALGHRAARLQLALLLLDVSVASAAGVVSILCIRDLVFGRVLAPAFPPPWSDSLVVAIFGAFTLSLVVNQLAFAAQTRSSFSASYQQEAIQ